MKRLKIKVLNTDQPLFAIFKDSFAIFSPNSLLNTDFTLSNSEFHIIKPAQNPSFSPNYHALWDLSRHFLWDYTMAKKLSEIFNVPASRFI